MVTASDIVTIQRQYLLSLNKGLALLNQGGYIDPITDSFVAFTPTQIANIKTRINNVLAQLQSFVAGLATV